MSLAATIGVVSLIAILAVATMSLSGRLVQGSSLALHDARLDAAAGHGLAAVTEEWRARSLGLMATGDTRQFAPFLPGVPVSVAVAVTRLSDEIFWVVSAARGAGGAERRENLVLRVRAPDATPIISDSSDVVSLGFLNIDSIAVTADLMLDDGAQRSAPSGVVHALGDLTLTGGSAEGILIVEGRLVFAGPVQYRGVIIVRGGISVASPQVSVSGLVRVSADPSIAGGVEFEPSPVIVQDVLAQSLRPVAVRGRRWAEIQ